MSIDGLFCVSPDKNTEYLLSADVLPCMALFSYAMIQSNNIPLTLVESWIYKIINFLLAPTEHLC